MNGIGTSVEQMTQGHLRNVQQLAVFYTGHGNLYAINIAKVKAFIITEEVTINTIPTQSKIIAGIATIRNEPITLVNLDAWLGEEKLELKDYKLIIYCEFNHKQIGFLVKNMLDIIEKTTDQLKYSEEQNSKIIYTTYIEIDKVNQLCTVFNAEQLLKDIGWTDDGSAVINRYASVPFTSDKIVLAAEDSAVARDILNKFFAKTHINSELFINGLQLIERIQELDPADIGLVITDIEMPEADGFQVASFIRNNAKYSSIPIIVNSSMTTEAVKDKMKQLGVDEFIGKTDIPNLYQAVKRYLD